MPARLCYVAFGKHLLQGIIVGRKFLFVCFSGSAGISYLVPTCTDRLESEGMLFVCSSTQIFLSTHAINCAPFSWSSLM